MSTPWRVLTFFLVTSATHAAPLPTHAAAFLETHCAACHDDVAEKAGLDLTSLSFTPTNPVNFAIWVKVIDRVSAGEMPPKRKPRPDAAAQSEFLAELTLALTETERNTLLAEGRATRRRMNRYEYENALRDLFDAPWLQVRDSLPEDTERFRFNKVGDALDVSHVNLARYLAVAEDSLRQVIGRQLRPVAATTQRYYAREQRTFAGRMTYSVFITNPERATFPVLDSASQPEVRSTKLPITEGNAAPATRALEGMGMVASAYEPIEPRFDQFRAAIGGRYRVRLCGQSLWVGPGKPKPGKPHRWWIPDLDNVAHGRRSEPVALYAEVPGRMLRRLGAFDLGIEATVGELDVVLSEGETIRPDAVRLFRSRPPSWVNPLATPEGQPGVAYRWLEVEGPLPDLAAPRLLGEIATNPGAKNLHQPTAEKAAATEEILLREFMALAYRRPPEPEEVQRFQQVVQSALERGDTFTDAMVSGYTAVLCSPQFLYLDEIPGPLTSSAIADRLAFFLWNSPPDRELRQLAASGQLREPAVLRAQTDRLLDDPRAGRFVAAFLDYWLDLRHLQASAPDSSLYNDYYLDDALADSALEETRCFFSDLLARNAPAHELIDADFAFVNERLAAHYGLPPIDGVAIRRIALPADSVRGGLLTQASILKVSANGTTTSPVLRGVWMMERLVGLPPSPPPPNITAVEPDTRGATTIREQLALHRSDSSCAACHRRIDPIGFALENFDVLGGWRSRYRAVDEHAVPAPGIGKNGQKFAFHFAQPVDAAGELWDGRTFRDVRDLKRLLVQDERLLARNLVRQLSIYATGSPVRFSDRTAIEAMLDRTQPNHFGLRDLVHALIESELFLDK